VCKKLITNSQPFVKKNEKISGPLGGGGFFWTHTVVSLTINYSRCVVSELRKSDEWVGRSGYTLPFGDALDVLETKYEINIYSASQKKIPPTVFWNFCPNCWEFLLKFFTHLLYEHLYTRLRIFIQISPTLTKLCHTKRDHLANFYISLELWLLSLLTEQMTSLLTSCHIPHVCSRYKSVYL